MQAGIQWDRERLDPAFAGVTRRLAAEQLLLLIDIFLRNVAGRDERVDAGLGHVTGVLLEADVEKLAAKPILVAELVVLPGAGSCTALVTVTDSAYAAPAKPSIEAAAIRSATR